MAKFRTWHVCYVGIVPYLEIIYYSSVMVGLVLISKEDTGELSDKFKKLLFAGHTVYISIMLLLSSFNIFMILGDICTSRSRGTGSLPYVSFTLFALRLFRYFFWIRVLNLVGGSWKGQMIAPFVVIFLIVGGYSVLLLTNGGPFFTIPFVYFFVLCLLILLDLDDIAKDNFNSVLLKIVMVTVAFIATIMMLKLRKRKFFEVRTEEENEARRRRDEEIRNRNRQRRRGRRI